MTMLEKINESSRFLRPLVGEGHEIGIILGSGLGSLGEHVEVERSIPDREIPHVPVSTVAGEPMADSSNPGRPLLRCRPHGQKKG